MKQPEISHELLQLLQHPEALKRELAERSLYEFVKQAWYVVEPGVPFKDGRHIEVICRALEATLNGANHNLVINIPPRCMKSLLVCVFFPAWVWIRKPHIKFLTASYSLNLATRDAVKCRRLIESPWYQERWKDRFQLAPDQNQKTKFENTKGGHRIVCSPDAQTTGEGGDFLLVDDPINAMDAYSDAERQKVITWWDEAMYNRLNDVSTGCRIIIGQRIHTEDLSGHCLAKGNFQHLCLPMEFEHSLASPYDWRTQEGQLLWEDRFPPEEIAELKKNSRHFAGQYQQRPIPPGGTIIKTEWIRYYHQLPERFDIVLQSWDLIFGGSKNTDFVVGQVWGKRGADFYLIDQVRGRWSFTEQIQQIRALSARYPLATTKLIENKANGAAAIDTLKGEISGIIPINPSKSKEVRLNAVSPLFEAGNVHIPSNASWTSDYTFELTSFGSAPHDDMVDATTQALTRLTGKAAGGVFVSSYI